MRKPKLQIDRGIRIETLLLREAAKVPPNGNGYRWTPDDVMRALICKVDCAHGWQGTLKDQDTAAMTVCKRCCQESEAAQAVWIKAGGNIYAFPGSEDEALAQLNRALDEAEVERKLAPLLKEEFKNKVHEFLASRAIFAKKGGRYKAKQYMQHWADGYIAAWEKFDGAKAHQRPYILTPQYGNGNSGVAYLLAIPPSQLLKEAEEAFAVHLVMSV
jgi:hypothetical protein